jgi:hypothetical protein
VSRDPDWLQSAETAAVKKAFRAQQDGALGRLLAAAAESPDANVRQAWAEYRAFSGSVAAMVDKDGA